MANRTTSAWYAQDMDALTETIDWPAKDAQKPMGRFYDDYAALCRIFEVPGHPCLVPRRSENATTEESTSPAASSSKSTLHLRNFIVDIGTTRIMVEALKRSTDIDSLHFHNAGLSDQCVDTLVEGLQQTTVGSLSLDYNDTTSVKGRRSRTTATPVELAESVQEESAKASGTTSSSARTWKFVGFIGEGSRLKALSLRGNRIDDDKATALAHAIEENTTLCSLNLFDNLITDAGASAFGRSLRLNTVLRGLSLAKNRLTSATAEIFGLLLAGGYEVLPPELEKRAIADAKIATQNKIAQDAMKKKKDAQVETRSPLSVLIQKDDGSMVAGGNRSLAALNLANNPRLGAGGALVELLTKIADARRAEGDAEVGGSNLPAVALQELHLSRCLGCGGTDLNESEEHAALMAGALRVAPTRVTV